MARGEVNRGIVMAEMGAYCKAFPASLLRAFAAWPAADVPDDAVVYLHDNYVVTRGIFHDEQVVFADGSDSWRAFCASALQFRVPDYCQANPSGRSFS